MNKISSVWIVTRYYQNTILRGIEGVFEDREAALEHLSGCSVTIKELSSLTIVTDQDKNGYSYYATWYAVLAKEMAQS